MRILGFKVADLAQAFEYFEHDWVGFINGEKSLEDLILRHDEEGFEATSDLPFNGLALKAYEKIGTDLYRVKSISRKIHLAENPFGGKSIWRKSIWRKIHLAENPFGGKNGFARRTRI